MAWTRRRTFNSSSDQSVSGFNRPSAKRAYLSSHLALNSGDNAVPMRIGIVGCHELEEIIESRLQHQGKSRIADSMRLPVSDCLTSSATMNLSVLGFKRAEPMKRCTP